MSHKPINGWTKQEIISTIRLRPNWQSKVGEKCKYRDDHGGMCAVGVFIPDDVYHESCEPNLVGGLLCNYIGLGAYMPLDRWALAELQRVHDQERDELDINAKLVAWVEENVT